MSISAISSLAFSAASFGSIFKLIVALLAFTDYQNLVLGTPGLAIGSHVTTNYTKTIWVYEQAFLSWSKV